MVQPAAVNNPLDELYTIKDCDRDPLGQVHAM